MNADHPFFDTSYLARFYLEDVGFEAVRDLAGTARTVAAAWHAQAEVVAALHRSFRERKMKRSAFRAAVRQFAADRSEGLIRWFPLDESGQRRVEQVFTTAPPAALLRAADALHLACAAEHGFHEVYSNEQRLLEAAPLFGLRGINTIK
jgi:predicted nucleic acid-binding protein